MTGLVTDVLVKFLLGDDTEQGRQALEMMKSLSVEGPGWIGQSVLTDLAFQLTRHHKLKRAELCRILDKLLSSKELVVENNAIVLEAVRLYRHGKADFPDCLIAVSAKAAGCSRTVTFDRHAARDAGMELLQ